MDEFEFFDVGPRPPRSRIQKCVAAVQNAEYAEKPQSQKVLSYAIAASILASVISLLTDKTETWSEFATYTGCITGLYYCSFNILEGTPEAIIADARRVLRFNLTERNAPRIREKLGNDFPYPQWIRDEFPFLTEIVDESTEQEITCIEDDS